MNGPAGPIIYPAYLNQKGAEFLFRFGRAKGAHNDVRDIVYAHPPWPATGPMGPMPHRGRDIFITLWPSDRPIILPSFAKERGKSFLYNLSSIDHPGRNPTSFLLFLSSFEESFEDTCHTRGRRRRGRVFRKVARIVSRISSVSPSGESATTTTLLRRIDATWSTTEGLACPQGGREMGRGLEATKRVGGAVPWWPPVRYSFLRVTRADLYDP